MSHAYFPGNKRLRLGIWGLGRGSSFYHTCEALGIDVVAGCDYTKHMRDGFLAKIERGIRQADAGETGVHPGPVGEDTAGTGFRYY